MTDKRLYDFAQGISDAIFGITGCHVTISDTNNIRIAGTGDFKNTIGEKIPEFSAFKSAREKKKTIIVRDPKADHECVYCDKRGICQEKFEICSPIIFEDTVIGVLGLIATTEAQRDFLMDREESFYQYIEQMAALLASHMMEIQIKNRIELQNKELNVVINNINNGVICISQSGAIKHINDGALKMLGKKSLGKVTNIKKLWPGSLLDQAISEEDSRLEIKGQDLINQGGKENLVSSHIIKIYENGQLSSLVGSFADSDSIQKTAARIRESSSDISFDNLLGQAPNYVQVKEAAKIAAAFDSNILITGESGTGKELFARSIHEGSPRRSNPFVSINCSAIPENLLESELFGYEGGAFTGAREGGKIGKMEIANKGTFFLDEIADMNLYLQSKMLRVLQDMTITRVGGLNPIKLDLKIIAATNKDLEKMVKEGLFREDLYYRLNVVPIKIPALRERRSDIELISQYFIDLNNKRFNKNIKGFSKEAMDLMKAYSWPGNIRELENIIEYISNFISDGYIEVDHLKTRINIEKTTGLSLNDRVKLYEEKLIQDLLKKYGSDEEGKAKVAEELQISRATLYRKMKYQS
ncbi:MAG: sigma 54-interacting transcriptional regulator [Bacillota bacterium]|nr:sigma 54-interacting transcriptional regulator [Bacillota bacterium]